MISSDDTENKISELRNFHELFEESKKTDVVIIHLWNKSTVDLIRNEICPPTRSGPQTIFLL